MKCYVGEKVEHVIFKKSFLTEYLLTTPTKIEYNIKVYRVEGKKNSLKEKIPHTFMYEPEGGNNHVRDKSK